MEALALEPLANGGGYGAVFAHGMGRKVSFEKYSYL